MTADEYLTILAEVDPELADELRTQHMAHVEFAVSRYKGNPAMVLFCIHRQLPKNTMHIRVAITCIDREMDARLEWFK